MPHIKFNWIDIFFVTILLSTGYIGFRKGFLPEFFRCLSLVTAFVFSFNNYTLLSDWISSRTKLAGAKPDVISFLAILLGAVLLVNLLYIVFKLILRAEKPQLPSMFVGLLLGWGRGLLLVSLIYLLLANGPFEYLARSAREKSFSGIYVYSIAPRVFKFCIMLYPWERVETPLVKMLENKNGD